MISIQNRPRIELLLCFFLPLAAAAVLLVAGIGDFGLWEPHETQHLKNASLFSDMGTFSPGDALAAAGSEGAQRELGARLPSVVLAFVAALCVGLSALVLGGCRFAMFALFALVGAPVFLFHGRQVTGGAPLLAAETLSFAGLALVAFGERRSTAVGGIAAAVVGLSVAMLCEGAIIGISVPSGAVAVALVSTGASKTFRRKATFAATMVLCLGGVAAFSIAAALGLDAPAITAGLSVKPAAVDCTAAIGQIAYGFFPWSALLPLLLAGASGPSEEDARRKSLRALAIGGIALGLVGQTFYTALHGPSPLFLAIPVAFGVAVVLEDLERGVSTSCFAALVVIAAALVMARDFAQQPASILTGYAIASIKTPDVFKPFVHAIIATAPFLLLVVVAGFVRGGEGALRRMRVRLLVPLASISFGGFIAFSMVPALTVHFSSKHALQEYEKFAKKGEPVAVFGAPSPIPNGKILASRSALVDWLSRDDRVFALLPPRELAALDKDYRAARGKHVPVLDMSSTRLLLATSALGPGERDVNPIARDVLSTPFPKSPGHPMQVNFEDKLVLLGWDVVSPAGPGTLKRGADFTLTTYWKCTAPLPQSYKMFVHIDGKGPRISGDHDPLSGAYPTMHWNTGDYIRDVYEGSIAAVQESGSYTIRTGLYRGDKRLTVIGDASAAQNSVLLGTVPLE